MKHVRLAVFAGAIGAATLAFSPIVAEMTVEVGGTPMLPSKTIVENAVASKDFTTLSRPSRRRVSSRPCRATGRSPFSRPSIKPSTSSPREWSRRFSNPKTRPNSVTLLTYHVVFGKFNAADFVAAAKNGGGKATFKTIEGEDLIVTHNGRKLEVIDAKGGKAIVDDPRRQSKERRHSCRRYGAPTARLREGFCHPEIFVGGLFVSLWTLIVLILLPGSAIIGFSSTKVSWTS